LRRGSLELLALIEIINETLARRPEGGEAAPAPT
jgi:hypothetical protein